MFMFNWWIHLGVQQKLRLQQKLKFFMPCESHKVQSSLWNLKAITAAEIRCWQFLDSFQSCCSKIPFYLLSSIIFRKLQKTGQDKLIFCQTSEGGSAENIREPCNVRLVGRCNESFICAGKLVQLSSWGFLEYWL